MVIKHGLRNSLNVQYVPMFGVATTGTKDKIRIQYVFNSTKISYYTRQVSVSELQ